jgi:hypothetical protein
MLEKHGRNIKKTHDYFGVIYQSPVLVHKWMYPQRLSLFIVDEFLPNRVHFEESNLIMNSNLFDFYLFDPVRQVWIFCFDGKSGFLPERFSKEICNHLVISDNKKALVPCEVVTDDMIDKLLKHTRLAVILKDRSYATHQLKRYSRKSVTERSLYKGIPKWDILLQREDDPDSPIDSETDDSSSEE